MCYNTPNYNGVMWVCVSVQADLHLRLAMKKFYCICKKLICVEAESFPGDNADWQIFEAEEGKADISIECKICKAFPEMQGESRGRAGDFEVSVSGETVYRAFPMANSHGALTRYLASDTSHSETFFTEKSFPIMADSRYMWSSVSLAQLILAKNAFFLHSSFISVGGKAILFSAASGVGKSTQAALWQKHRGAEIINGDKAGILVEDGVYACGVPFCGTSGICQNRVMPLGAIVLLSQSEANSVERLKGVEALQGVLRNVHLDLLAPDEQRMIFDLLINLLARVPVYFLKCTASEEAVNALETALCDGGVIDGT